MLSKMLPEHWKAWSLSYDRTGETCDSHPATFSVGVRERASIHCSTCSRGRLTQKTGQPVTNCHPTYSVETADCRSITDFPSHCSISTGLARRMLTPWRISHF